MHSPAKKLTDQPVIDKALGTGWDKQRSRLRRADVVLVLLCTLVGLDANQRAEQALAPLGGHGDLARTGAVAIPSRGQLNWGG
jgi:hypothetical protein